MVAGMPRLTAELIAEAPQFTNPVKDWEVDLRGTFVRQTAKASHPKGRAFFRSLPSLSRCLAVEGQCMFSTVPSHAVVVEGGV